MSSPIVRGESSEFLDYKFKDIMVISKFSQFFSIKDTWVSLKILTKYFFIKDIIAIFNFIRI